LQILHWIPVMLNKYNSIGSSEIQTKTSDMCCQQQDIYRRITVKPTTELYKQRLTYQP